MLHLGAEERRGRALVWGGIDGRQTAPTQECAGAVSADQPALRADASQHLREHWSNRKLQQVAPPTRKLGQGLGVIALEQYDPPAEIRPDPAPQELRPGRGLTPGLEEAGERCLLRLWRHCRRCQSVTRKSSPARR